MSEPLPILPSPRFVHLRLHSEYSIQDSILRIDDAIKLAKTGCHAGAGVDRSGQCVRPGEVLFRRAQEGRQADCRLRCLGGAAGVRDKPTRLLLLVQDTPGWRNLCELLTRAYRSNMHRGRAILQPAWFDADSTAGLIALVRRRIRAMSAWR